MLIFIYTGADRGLQLETPERAGTGLDDEKEQEEQREREAERERKGERGHTGKAMGIGPLCLRGYTMTENDCKESKCYRGELWV
jgi:hypothetical protein